jgi:hypothetical protein
MPRRSEFSGLHQGHALYQGTTLVVPLRPGQELGFSPWVFPLAGKSRQGLKPNSLSFLYGTTKVVLIQS